MRRMLLLACAVGLCGSVAVVALAADAPLADRPTTPTPDAYSHGEYRPSTPPRAGTRVQLISRVAERLDVDGRAMWRAVADVRRQIAPGAWSDARDEALRMLARELERPFTEVERAVRIALRHELKGYGAGW